MPKHAASLMQMQMFIIIFNPWKISKVCEISQKNWAVPGFAQAPFSPKF